MVFQNNVLAGGAGGSGTTTYAIDQSIRFNEADNAYMYRTPSSSSNQRTWTWSGWLKFTDTSTNGYHNIWVSRNGSTSYFELVREVNQSGNFRIDVVNKISGTDGLRLVTNRQFRDPSAWYHLVFVSDTTNAVSTERFRIYVNGQRETSFSTETYPSQNYDTYINSTDKHEIGAFNGGSGYMMDGYMAEITFVDGQALDPSSFGEYNSSNIWIPKDVSGLTFGTNGFHIDGRDSADLGDDESGNGNDFTTSGLAAHDQVLDSPTNNFAVLNPLDNRGTPGTLSEGNLKMAFSATNDNVTGTFGMSSGKWYWEAHIVDKSDTYIGVQDSAISATGYTASAVALWSGSYIYENNSDTGDRSVSYNNGDVVGIAFDADNKKIWWSKNGQWYSADDSSANTTINISEVEAGNQAQVITRSPDFFMPFFGNYTHSTAIFNFGQEGTFAGNETAGGNSDGNGVGNFFSAVPSGFLALCTKNLGS
jgi:hypothetical protein